MPPHDATPPQSSNTAKALRLWTGKTLETVFRTWRLFTQQAIASGEQADGYYALQVVGRLGGWRGGWRGLTGNASRCRPLGSCWRCGGGRPAAGVCSRRPRRPSGQRTAGASPWPRWARG